MLYFSFFLICHPLSPVICIYDPAVFEPVLFQQMLHDLIISVGVDLQVAAPGDKAQPRQKVKRRLLRCRRK